MKKVLVIGGGGREHAICFALKKTSTDLQIFCADGNGGTSLLAENIALKPFEIEKLADFAQLKKIDLTIVGGETALALGICDEFQKRGLRIFGASRAASRLESSKAFAKDFMARNSIPTAIYRVAETPEKALQLLGEGIFGDEKTPVVVKADGLAAGKGVVVAENRAAAEKAVRYLMVDKSVGDEAAQTIVLEEFLKGREVSLLLFADGKNFALMPPVRDHKRIGEGDTGENTGGMGTICDPELLSAGQLAEIEEKIVRPTLEGARREGFPFKGILFIGLMMTADGAKVLEYNVRFGDPETQCLMSLLETNLADICEAVIDEKLIETEVRFQNKCAACVILAAENYPHKPRVGDKINGLEDVPNDINIFHSGTKSGGGEFQTSGGRVLGITATAENLPQAIAKAYSAVEKINFQGMQFRRDIGS